MIDLALLATSAWTMIQPHLPVLATAVAGEISKKVPEVVSMVWEKIKQKFESKPAAKEALEDVIKAPDDPDTQAAFRQQLKKALADDDSFATELSKLLEAAGDTYKASLTGDGAIAQGSGAKAVGKGGVMIGGNVDGNVVLGNEDNINSDPKKKNDRTTP
jgi:hypothetical protein